MSFEPARFDFSIPVRVNLYSDTQTRPSAAMKQAMVEAAMGDEQIFAIKIKVEHRNFVAGRHQFRNQARADITGATGHQ